MLSTENMDRFCGCFTRPQTVPQNPAKPSAQNSNSMKKTVNPGIANWSMSSLIAFRTNPNLLGKLFFVMAKFPFPLTFPDAEHEVGGAWLERIWMITITITAYPSHQIRSGVERPNVNYVSNA